MRGSGQTGLVEGHLRFRRRCGALDHSRSLWGTSGAILATLTFCASTVSAQPCRQDRDCEGTLICEGGTCVDSGIAETDWSEPDAAEEPAMAPPPQDVQIHFQLPAQDERWVAYDTRGVMLCTLPCRKRVERGATVWLRADGDASAGIPLELAGSTADEITATPRGGADTTVPWIVLGAGLLGAGVAAAVMAGTEGQAQTGGTFHDAVHRWW